MNRVAAATAPLVMAVIMLLAMWAMQTSPTPLAWMVAMALFSASLMVVAGYRHPLSDSTPPAMRLVMWLSRSWLARMLAYGLTISVWVPWLRAHPAWQQYVLRYGDDPLYYCLAAAAVLVSPALSLFITSVRHGRKPA